VQKTVDENVNEGPRAREKASTSSDSEILNWGVLEGVICSDNWTAFSKNIVHPRELASFSGTVAGPVNWCTLGVDPYDMVLLEVVLSDTHERTLLSCGGLGGVRRGNSSPVEVSSKNWPEVRPERLGTVRGIYH